MSDVRRDASSASRRLSLGVGAGVLVCAAAAIVGLRGLQDNSFFTHLATGRLILDTGSVPSHDPYTFTAAGEPWVVQSWLASLLYASVESIGGADALRLLMGAIAAAVAGIGWHLTRSAESLVVRLGVAVLFVSASAELWAERPFMLGLVALGLTMLAAQCRLDPRWLVPIAWIWVNVHGSFPLGVVLLITLALGRRLDGESWSQELAALRWLVVGILVGAVGPLGPRVLVFPIELLQRQDLLSNVIEWRAPTFDSFSQRMFLVQVVVAVLLLTRRPTYRAALPLVVFTAAALLGVRNLAVASLVLLPGMAAAAPRLGTLRSPDRGVLAPALAAAGVGLVALVGSSRLQEPDFAVRRYAVDAVAFLEQSGFDLDDHRLAAPDDTGNFRELVYGPRGDVFYDDRFDMFPEEVSAAHVDFVQGGLRLRGHLDELEIELALSERAGVTAQRLITDADWRLLYTDERWALLCRRGADLGGADRHC